MTYYGIKVYEPGEFPGAGAVYDNIVRPGADPGVDTAAPGYFGAA
jgi:hypothetical protein